MREKWKALLARVPRLTRGQKLARNLICCVLLAALLLAGLLYFDCIRLGWVPTPAEWRFRLAERGALLQPGEMVARLPVKDALPWDPSGPSDRDEARSAFSSEYRNVSFLLDRRDGWLRVFEAGYLDRIMGIFPAGPGDVPVCFYDLHIGFDFQKRDSVPELADLIVYSDLPAVRAEAELAVRWGNAGDTVLRGGGKTENGACLIIAERVEEETPPEAVFETNEFWLRVRLLDENGAVLAERSGNVGYRGGWIE